MKVLVTAIGTMGNALPFLGWARDLARREHEVTVLGSPYLDETCRRLELDFAPVDSFEDGTTEEQRVRPRQTRKLLRQLAAEVRPLSIRLHREILARHVPRETVVIATSWQFGARIACDQLRIPLVTAVLQPYFLPHRMPRPGQRVAQRVIQRVMQRRIGPIVDSLRAEVGLPPVGRSFTEWTFSSELVVALFPEWFAPDLAEVPLPTIYTEFPRFDGLQEFTRSDELATFLDAGDPPILLSESSLSSQSGDSNGFDLSLEACRQIGRRAVLLSADERRVPNPLPHGVGYFGYLPLSTILPRCAAFVHHGGLGSLSQGLAAGVPQVTIPRFMDQPDNSRHLEALGVSRNLDPRRMTSETLAGALSELISSPLAKERCQTLKARVQSEVPFAIASEAVEQVARLSRQKVRQPVLC